VHFRGQQIYAFQAILAFAAAYSAGRIIETYSNSRVRFFSHASWLLAVSFVVMYVAGDVYVYAGKNIIEIILNTKSSFSQARSLC
jgi:hypothetical protein